MTLVASLGAFLVAAGLLTLTPGLDTMLVLRTTASEGRRSAAFAAAGIQLGCLMWGAAVALGLGALLTASATAYAVLTWCGAAYLAWIGLHLLLHPRRLVETPSRALVPAASSASWLRRGLLTNLLNPKIGVFYVSFLPQFVPAGFAAAPFVFGLAALHVALASFWMVLLISGTGWLRPRLQRPRLLAALDRATGVVFIAFGLRLVLRRAA